jgi:RND family efflux transporter MFP subunit
MAKLFDNIKKFKKRLGKWFWVILAAILVAVVVFFIRSKSSAEVETYTIQTGSVKEELILTGAVAADKHANLAFPGSGKISWVGVTEGQKVYKGQALTSLDKTTLNAAYQQALNNYRNYQAAADSAIDSVKDHANDESYAQKATRTAAEVARDNAYDAVKAAKYNLDNSTLFAPFAGIISSLPFSSPGVNVSFTDAQVEIVDLSTVYFDVSADQSEVIDLKEGQPVRVVLDSFSDRELNGKVVFISFTPKRGEAGAVYKVKVVFDASTFSETLPRIGMTGDAKFVLSQKENVLNVPPKFVNSDNEGKYVNLGKIGNKVRVEVGIEGEESVEIVSGVKEGDVLYD